MTCSKCGRDVPVGESWCACGGPSEFSARDRERMRVDVRARVLWADSVEAIREEWLKKGATGEEVRVALHDAIQERHRHFRTRGLVDLLSGTGCIFGVAILYFFAHHHDPESGKLFMGGRTLILAAALLAAGLWFAWRGVSRLATGGTREKGASDVED